MSYKNIEDKREASRRSYQKNKTKLLRKQKQKRQLDPDEFRRQRREYYEKNKERINEHNRNHYNKNIEHYRKKHVNYNKNRRNIDIEFKITENLRRRVRSALRNNSKSQKTLELIGCTPKDLKIHLESQFTEGMSWSNYGLNGWHIDHIKPCSSFDLTDPDQQKECFHYTNLQPLWAVDNLSKGNTYAI